MEFGIFDHLDRYDIPLRDYYAERMNLVELYDSLGFYCYHLAEHHGTPLGMAPSPSVFLAAVAERSRRLRFGPMVYALPLYHPLRLLEEICMLDQMSGGRLDIGFGRGASPIELEIFGQNPEKAEAVYREGLDLIIKGMSAETLTFHGETFHLDDVPMAIEPLQKPHPPIWYGVHAPESAERAARRGLHTINLDPTDEAAVASARYRSVWRECNGDAPLPHLGLGRFVVVAETDEAALAMARRAYPIWHASFTYLFRKHGRAMRHARPDDYDTLIARGQGVAGTPATVAAQLREQVQATGANYFVGQFSFGNLTLDECRRSITLFAEEVMPALRTKEPAAAQA